MLNETYVDRWFSKLLNESLLTEANNYDKQAAQILVDRGMCDTDQAQEIIKDLYLNKVKSLHHPSWAQKYIKGVARIFAEETNNDISKSKQFIDTCAEPLNYYINYIKTIRDKYSDADKLKLDNEFLNNLSYSDIVNKNEEIKKELDAESEKKLSAMQSTDKGYQLIPIDSYKQMHSMFGGSKTGDGASEGFAGDGHGGTAWCHTNAKWVYDSYMHMFDGHNKFFVLAKNGWQDIPYNSETANKYHGKDDYGNSLIAILVDNKTGNLLKATLRCNHSAPLRGDADNQYQTYAELSEIAGFNVKEVVFKNLSLQDWSNKVFTWDGSSSAPDDVVNVVIKDGVKLIGMEAFCNYKSLQQINIPNSVITIDEYAFAMCTSLKYVNIPDSVTQIGDGAFEKCTSLTQIRIPDSVTQIGDGLFCGCTSLRQINIPDSVTKIGWGAFDGCTSLQKIVIPDSVTEIDKSAFYRCKSLRIENIKMSDQLRSKVESNPEIFGLPKE